MVFACISWFQFRVGDYLGCWQFFDFTVPIHLYHVWFLAIASALNGIAHPVLSMMGGGYFPGLLTSPLVGILGTLRVSFNLSVLDQVISILTNWLSRHTQ